MSARCRFGGPAPCMDDMCHNGDTTLCGLQWGFDYGVDEFEDDDDEFEDDDDLYDEDES